MKLEVTLDCQNLDAVAAFWGAALQSPVEHTHEGRYAEVTCGELTVNLQYVAEPKAGKNRAHLDLLVEDLEVEVARLKSLRATKVAAHEELGQTWFVLRDPEGNELCLAQG